MPFRPGGTSMGMLPVNVPVKRSGWSDALIPASGTSASVSLANDEPTVNGIWLMARVRTRTKRRRMATPFLTTVKGNSEMQKGSFGLFGLFGLTK
jgi:hypothetical protein